MKNRLLKKQLNKKCKYERTMKIFNRKIDIDTHELN